MQYVFKNLLEKNLSYGILLPIFKGYRILGTEGKIIYKENEAE